MSQDKRVIWDANYLNSISGSELYILTKRQAQAALTAITVMQWSTRWINASPQYQQDFSSEMELRLMTDIDFCLLVAECIQDDSRVRDAIEQIAQRYSGTTDSDRSTGSENGVNLLEGVGCTDSEISGAIDRVIEYVIATARDVVEIVLSQTTDAEALARVIGTIPIFGDLPIVNDVAGWISWVRSRTLDDFEAGLTEQLTNDVFCYIYERSCATCDLTIETIISGFAATAGISIADSKKVGLLLSALTGTLLDRAFAYGLCALVAASLGAGGRVFDIVGVSSLRAIAASSSTSNTYTLCDDCPANIWNEVFDFTVTDGNWATYDSIAGGVWQSGTGWVSTCQQFATETREVIRIQIATNIPTNVTDVTVEYIAASGGNRNDMTVQYESASNPDVELGRSTFVINKTNTLETVSELNMDYEPVNFIELNAITGQAPCSGNITIVKLVLSGIGLNPFS